MNQLSSSERFVVQSALSNLAGYLRRHIETTEETAALIDAGGRPDGEIEWVAVPKDRAGLSAMDPNLWNATSLDDLAACTRIDALKLPTFRRAIETMRRHGLTTQADEVLLLFGESFTNTAPTLAYAEALLADLKQVGGDGKPDDGEATPDDSQPDGPVPPDLFSWNGGVHGGLSPVPWRLIATLWKAKNRAIDYRDLGELVWGDREVVPDDNAIGTARKTANAFFEGARIPLRVSKKGDYVCLKDAPRE